MDFDKTDAARTDQLRLAMKIITSTPAKQRYTTVGSLRERASVSSTGGTVPFPLKCRSRLC